MSYVNAGGERENEGSLESCDITVFPMFAAPYKADFTVGAGGHGGGDNAMLADLFGEPGHDPLQRAADHHDGAMSILTGIAGNISMQQQRPVAFKEFELVSRLKR
jgi:hypothetical protein